MEKTVKIPGQIFLCGLWWDTENLTDGYCNFYEAVGRAYAEGKRLPTKEEFERLSRLPHVWDEERKGMWFAEDESDLKNPVKSLLFPAMGYQNLYNGIRGNISFYDTDGYYWSSTLFGENSANYLYFYDIGVSMQSDNCCTHNLSIRCVSTCNNNWV
jgi:uncharacterized protein (TIGR02145 family)